MHAKSWWMWICQPWRSAAVACALVGSLCLPALLLSSGPMFRRSASDTIAQRVAGALDAGPAGLVVSGSGTLGADAIGEFVGLVEARLARIEELGAPERTLFSDRLGVVQIGAEPLPGNPVRLLARAGATDAVDIIEGGPSDDGVLIPHSLAERTGLGAGDLVQLAGRDPVPVSGVYRDLWDGELNEYWRAAPAETVPTFVRAFNQPSFELVLASDGLFTQLGPSGRLRWDVPLEATPSTWNELRVTTARYRGLQRALVRDEALDEAYRAFASDPEDPPDVFTALFTAEDDAADLIAELDRPIRTATIAGVVAGLLLSTAGAIFLLRRYRTEHRLMAADGDAAARFFGRALAQYAAPAFAGALLGVAFAWLVIEISGPSGRADLETVPWPLVIAVSVFAWGLASLVTAVAAVRLTDALDVDVGAIRTTWLALLLGAVVVMWVQVGQADHSETIDASTIALPLAGILAGVVLTVVLLRVLLHALRRTGRRLPTPLFLAWRALTASESGALVLTAALGLATGLAVLSATFVDSIDTAVELKTSTAVGAASRLEAIDRVDPAVVPAGSTIIRTLTTEARTAAGDAVTVDVLAIDPDTFAGAVDWPDEFGGTADDLVERLSDDGGVVVPVVIVEGRSLGSSGEFGGERVFPYESVGTVRSTPLASADHPTIVVRTDTFETVARRRWENGLEGVDPVEIEVAEALGREIEYVPPLTSFGNTIVSRQPIEVLTALGEQEGWRVREAVSAAEEVRSIDVAASRWGFEYLRILSTIAGVVALTALAFYLTERRAQREVSTVMTEQMGISRTTNVLAAIAEVVGLVAASLAVGVVTAIVTARRVFPVLEPSPDLAPTVGLTVDPVQLLGLAGIVIIAVSIAAAWAQRAASAAQKAAVLRG